jgi:tRNA modification GTPase
VGRVLLGSWRRTDGTEEELLISRLGKQHWEIHCHGGVAAVDTILTDLRGRGVFIVPWAQWIRQQADDPLQSAAQLELTRALTPRTAAVLLDQYRGALRDELQSLLTRLEQPEAAREAIDELQQRFIRLLERSRVGLHLTRPWRVALVGPPNVGKSSLLNRLVGFQRAIVFDQPGTTRDVVTAQTAFDGWPVELFDTAGMREVGDRVEQTGVAMARRAAKQADLLVFLVGTDSWQHGAYRVPAVVETAGGRAELPDLESLRLPTEIPSICVLSKWDLRMDANQPVPDGWLGVSSKNGEGLPALMEAITRQLVPNPPLPGEPVPFLPHHPRRLDASLQAVRAKKLERARDELTCLLTDQGEAGREGPEGSSRGPS